MLQWLQAIAQALPRLLAVFSWLWRRVPRQEIDARFGVERMPEGNRAFLSLRLINKGIAFSVTRCSGEFRIGDATLNQTPFWVPLSIHVPEREAREANIEIGWLPRAIAADIPDSAVAVFDGYLTVTHSVVRQFSFRAERDVGWFRKNFSLDSTVSGLHRAAPDGRDLLGEFG